MSTIRTETLIVTAVATMAIAFVGCDKEKAADTEAAVTPEAAEQVQSVVSAPVQMEPAKPLSKTVVTVNGKPLLRADMMEEINMMASSPQFAAMPPEQGAMFRQQMEGRLVDRFMNQIILTGEADKQDIAVSDADIEKMLEEIRGSLPPQMTLEQIMEERKMSMEKLRSDITTDLRIRTLLEKQTESIPEATDEAIAAFYEENKDKFKSEESAHARHILIKVAADADAETKAAKKAEIEGYQKQIADGTAEFEKLAGEHSDCPSGERGGDLGSFGRGQMVPAFETAAFAQEINVVGPVIETQFGYHIIQVIERTEAGERALEDVKEEIGQQLSGREKQTVVETYLAALRDKAEITYGDE
jgi:peptidyl-prolyl cis-trans isomerase C